MINVGLVTMFEGNYGSILQCYATKKHIEKSNIKCNVFLKKIYGRERLECFIKSRYRLILNTVKYGKEYSDDFFELRRLGLKSRHYITDEAREAMKFFVDSEIRPIPVSNRMQKKYAEREDYIAIIAGSDQIWNCSFPINDFFFLDFAPSEKKIALAPSFGSNKVAKYNRGRLKKFVSTFNSLSVREEEGRKILKDICGIDVQRIADPTAMLTREEWVEFAANSKFEYSNHMLLHFLDTPSEEALKFIEKAKKEKPELQIIVFSYYHDEFKEFDNVIEISGSPTDYVKLMENAGMVCTDSFHTVAFSIYLQKSFYVFDRQYQHSKSQSGRISQILGLYKLDSRFIHKVSDSCVIFENLPDCSSILELERKKTIEYIDNAIKNRFPAGYRENESDSKIKDAEECCGCYACIDICPHNAIKLEPDVKGYHVPEIDDSKCIDCGKCAKVCNRLVKTNDSSNLKGYVAYNKNSAQRLQSASGGSFSAIATSFINSGGIVYGAGLYCTDNSINVVHSRIDNTEKLQEILKSKYVQSDCTGIYKKVKQDLEKGVKVLFCGTPCQINAVYAFISNKLKNNLYTIDLICHGVPGQVLFNDYIRYLEKKHGGKIIDFRFRTKKDGKIEYTEEVAICSDGQVKKVYIPYDSSPYYTMFLSQESYREKCYDCEFASVYKRPGDITIGDYFEIEKDYPELKRQIQVEDISCIITNTLKGESLLKQSAENLELYEVEYAMIQRSHPNLYRQSMFSHNRYTLLDLYKNGGIASIAKFYKNKKRLQSMLYFIKK